MNLTQMVKHHLNMLQMILLIQVVDVDIINKDF
jgi:hypothetical protein